MELARAVQDYYFAHLESLPVVKRFHFANRMAAWDKDPRAMQLLSDYGAWYVPSDRSNKGLAAALHNTGDRAVQGAHRINSWAIRKPFFDRYPGLIALEAQLCQLRYWNVFYGVDATGAFLSLHSLDWLQSLESALLADTEAVRSLSTWAVNYTYLLHILLLDDAPAIDPTFFYTLGESYVHDAEHLRLLSYLYTHCIIADSNFYIRPVPKHSLPVYHKMLDHLSSLFAKRFTDFSLDTKLEFLVCCRLAGYATSLTRKIHAECAASLSPDGTFLIDTHNVFAADAHKKKFIASEHRNVLFIMSVLPHQPLY